MSVSSATSSSSTKTSTTSSISSSSATTVLAQTDKFLTLLMKELENQDPTNPVDATTYVNQLFQVAQLSQSVANGEKLDKMTTAVGQLTFSSAATGYLGHTVEAESSTAALSSGTAQWDYQLDSKAATVTLKVLDDSGNVIYTTSGETASGYHTFTWKGTETGGSTASDGNYTLKVTATDADGGTVTSNTYISGSVSSVDSSDGETVLNIKGVSVNVASVISVS